MTTVRSRDKADQIKHRYPDFAKDKLDFVIVEDIAQLEGETPGKNDTSLLNESEQRLSDARVYYSVRQCCHLRTSFRGCDTHSESFPLQCHRCQEGDARPGDQWDSRDPEGCQEERPCCEKGGRYVLHGGNA